MRIVFFIVFIMFYSCKKEINKDNGLTNSNETPQNNCIIDSYLYSSLDHISWGERWVDKESKREYIYRILISSSSEEKYLYYELFEIGEDGPVSFINREKIEPNSFGLNYFNSSLDVNWKSHNQLNLKLNEETFQYEIQKKSPVDQI